MTLKVQRKKCWKLSSTQNGVQHYAKVHKGCSFCIASYIIRRQGLLKLSFDENFRMKQDTLILSVFNVLNYNVLLVLLYFSFPYTFIISSNRIFNVLTNIFSRSQNKGNFPPLLLIIIKVTLWCFGLPSFMVQHYYEKQ